DRDNARVYDDAFRTHVTILTSRPEITGKVETDLAKGRTKLTGLLGGALGNVTFAGERDALLETLRAFSSFYAIDGKIRSLGAAGKRDKAIELCIGSESNESPAAFVRFDQAIEKVLAINQTAFDRVIEEGDAGLRTAEMLDPLFAIAIGALGFV